MCVNSNHLSRLSLFVILTKSLSKTHNPFGNRLPETSIRWVSSVIVWQYFPGWKMSKVGDMADTRLDGNNVLSGRQD